MTYDNNAKKVAVKVIGTVESNMAYNAINYSDPITVGFVQWFGTRAAQILTRMRDENAASWVGVAPSIDNDLRTRPQSAQWWTTRYLTTGEGESLRPVLAANELIQNGQLALDLEGYKNIAVDLGIDPDTHTDSMIFFFTMWHQGPLYAQQVVAYMVEQYGTANATLAQYFDGAMWHLVFQQYRGRYETARDMIAAGDNSGVELPGDMPDPNPENPIQMPGLNNTYNLAYVEAVGGSVMLHYKDGQVVTAFPDGRGRFLPATSTTAPPIPPDPEPNPGGGWSHPLPGSVVTSGFGPRGFDGFHYGIDFSTPGQAGIVVAPTDMQIVVASDTANWSAGTHVKGWTTTGEEYTFAFYHMVYGSLRVAVGDHVVAGQALGVEGATGNVTGRHCHFEAYAGHHPNPWPPPYGDPIDPEPILNAHGIYV